MHHLKGNIFIEKQKAIFYILPGGANLYVKASLISYLERKKKFDFPHNSNLVNDFHFPVFMKDISNPAFKNKFRFTIIRNPWDKLAACYREMICAEDLPDRFFQTGVEDSFNEYGNLFEKHMSFEAFVEAVCSIPDSKSSRYLRSQIYQLAAPTGDLLVNYIGYFERLKEASLDIYEHTQMSLHEVPNSKGRINDTSYTDLYTEELKNKVYEKFADDIDLFGYEFGVPLQKRMVDFVTDEFLQRYTSTKKFVDILKEKNKELNQKLSKTNKEVNQFKEKLSRKEYELDDTLPVSNSMVYKKKFEEIQHSLSWKITSPLRYFGGVISQLFSKK